MSAETNKTINLVLIGGGHTNSQVLRALCRNATTPQVENSNKDDENSNSNPPRLNLTLVSDRELAAYSGMWPACVANIYSVDQAVLNLKDVCDVLGWNFVQAKVTGIHGDTKSISLSSSSSSISSLSYDVAAVDVGSSTKGWGEEAWINQAINQGICVLATRPIVELIPKLEAFENERKIIMHKANSQLGKRKIDEASNGKEGAGGEEAGGGGGGEAGRSHDNDRDSSNVHVVVVGAGVAGVELAMSVRQRFRSQGFESSIIVLDKNDQALSCESPALSTSVLSAMKERGIRLLSSARVVAANETIDSNKCAPSLRISCRCSENKSGGDSSCCCCCSSEKLEQSCSCQCPQQESKSGCCKTSSSSSSSSSLCECNIPCDIVLLATGAAPHVFPDGFQVATTAEGWMIVDDYLASTSHGPDLFGAGDCIAMQNHPPGFPPRAGVHAVREGPPLVNNLIKRLEAKGIENLPPTSSESELMKYVPQTDFLRLICCGDGMAVGGKWGISFYGGWVWRLKDWLDRQWMQLFTREALEASSQAAAAAYEMRRRIKSQQGEDHVATTTTAVVAPRFNPTVCSETFPPLGISAKEAATMLQVVDKADGSGDDLAPKRNGPLGFEWQWVVLQRMGQDEDFCKAVLEEIRGK